MVVTVTGRRSVLPPSETSIITCFFVTSNSFETVGNLNWTAASS